MANEKLYNFLADAECDVWARERDQEPIEFNWGNVCDVDAIKRDDSYFNTPLYQLSKKKGIVSARWVVNCPVHGIHNQVIVFSDQPNRIADKCNDCISAELKRVDALRFQRRLAYRRERKNAQKGLF